MSNNFYTLKHQDWQVPAFTVQELKPRSQKYALCIPLINEGERIRRQLKQLLPYAGLVDIVLADGGSTDGALDTAYLQECQVTALLTKKGAGKLSAQMRMAMAWCIEQGYEGLVFIDGNNKDDVSAIPLFTAKLDAGYDHVQGSRYVPGGKAINTPPARHWGVQLLHAPLISIAAGFRYTDTTNGFRAYSIPFLLDERVQPFRDVFFAYELHYYLAIRAARLGFKVIEVPVTRAYPKGKTPSKIKGWKGNVFVLKTLWRSVTHQFNP